MRIRSIPTYWYQRKIIKLPNEKTEDLTNKNSDFKTRIEIVDSGPKKKKE